MEYLCVAQRFRCETVVRKSRFIATLIPIVDWDDATQQIKQIRKEFSDATHHCYAVVCDGSGNAQRFSDDGEPQGTAGMPMLDVLRKRGVCRTLAVVTRYFGGVKLGAHGLVGAYAGSVADALDRAPMTRYKSAEAYCVHCDYGVADKLMQSVRAAGGATDAPVYGNGVEFCFRIAPHMPQALSDRIADLTQGRADVRKIGQGVYAFETTGK